MEPIYSRGDCSRQLTRRQKGEQMEKLACHYLCQAGLRWIASNVSYRHGELDLIMLDEQTYVFVEVRYRKNCAYGDAAASVTWRKQQKIKTAAAYWLANQDKCLSTANCRFDVVAVTGSRVNWIKNAFY
ncbi:YraN family protein [Rosenbergiella nectarea]|uniref:YraN family protein n=1 Tax=Rosenbergiella nectarea TaxID=988801 RepID=UPI001BD96068|nr:YraN family protein [Rosenbergiella nectarea]MBT0728871.1 YraN family protein [Rosenbergiella nectarea subsp. apis]